MNSLERFNASIARRSFDRIPYSFSMAKELKENLSAALGGMEAREMEALFACDRETVLPLYTGGMEKSFGDGTYTNFFGVHMRDVSFGRGAYSEAVDYPLRDAETAPEVIAYPWPAGGDFDYSGIAPTMAARPDLPFTAGYLALGWHSWEMRGMEQFLEDLLLEPELAGAIIGSVSDFGYDYYRRVIETGRERISANFRCIHLADDWATQDGLLISTDMFRRFFRPHYRRLIDLAHDAGLLVEFHCCGSAADLIPELIDIGVDILNPVQTSARGMAPERLKAEFGGSIAFSGGLDVQTVMPFGTPDQVRAEVFHLLNTLGKGGGYILQPSHSLQVDTPPENVLAMIEAVNTYYGTENAALTECLKRAGSAGREQCP